MLDLIEFRIVGIKVLERYIWKILRLRKFYLFFFLWIGIRWLLFSFRGRIFWFGLWNISFVEFSLRIIIISKIFGKDFYILGWEINSELGSNWKVLILIKRRKEKKKREVVGMNCFCFFKFSLILVILVFLI